MDVLSKPRVELKIGHMTLVCINSCALGWLVGRLAALIIPFFSSHFTQSGSLANTTWFIRFYFCSLKAGVNMEHSWCISQ